MNWEDINNLINKYRNKSGLKGKIIAKCIECSVSEGDTGTWRMQIERCNCPACPLYDVRPISRPKINNEEIAEEINT